MLFARMARDVFRVPHFYVATQRGHPTLKIDDVREEDAYVLFNGPTGVDRWARRLQLGRAGRERWQLSGDPGDDDPLELPEELSGALLPLAAERRDKLEPFHDQLRIKRDHQVWFVIDEERADEVRAWLRDHGWQPAPLDARTEESAAAG